jgi:hypothetical protein
MWKTLLLAFALVFPIAMAAQLSAAPGETLCTADSIAPNAVPGDLAEGTHTAQLNWSPVGNALWYRMYRGSSSGGPYTLLADCITGTSYLDTVAPSQTLYYVVEAVDSSGASGNSNQAAGLIPLFDNFTLTIGAAGPPPPAAATYVIGDHAMAAAGSCAFLLQVIDPGAGFTPQTVVNWNGSARQTTYIYPRIVRASITATDLANGGTVTLTATTGGVTSTVGTFAVIAGAPTITATQHLGATLVLTGTNFVPRNTVIVWNGLTLQTAWYSPALVQGWLPPGIVIAGTAPVSVNNAGCESDY